MDILLLLNVILFFKPCRSITDFSSLLMYLIYYISVIQGKSCISGICYNQDYRLRLRPISLKKNVRTLFLNPQQTQVLASLAVQGSSHVYTYSGLCGAWDPVCWRIRGPLEDLPWASRAFWPQLSWEGFCHSTSHHLMGVGSSETTHCLSSSCTSAPTKCLIP